MKMSIKADPYLNKAGSFSGVSRRGRATRTGLRRRNSVHTASFQYESSLIKMSIPQISIPKINTSEDEHTDDEHLKEEHTELSSSMIRTL